MIRYLTPRSFLMIGGAVLVALGVLGFIVWSAGILKENSVFYLDNGENVAHVVLGVVALVAASVLKGQEKLLKPLVILVGIVSLFFGVYGFVVAGNVSPNVWGVANLENPLDNLLHLVVGVWALASALVKQPAVAGMKPKM